LQNVTYTILNCQEKFHQTPEKLIGDHDLASGSITGFSLDNGLEPVYAVLAAMARGSLAHD
jgi:hypothetical protein